MDLDFSQMLAGEGELPAEGAETMGAAPEVAEQLSALEPKDILQYLIDQGLLAPETTLLTEAEVPAEGEAVPAEPLSEPAPAGGDMSFEGMV